MCHGSIPILMSCPGKLQFDTTLNVCNWPSVVGCENSTPYPITTTAAPTTTAPMTSTTSQNPDTTTSDDDFNSTDIYFGQEKTTIEITCLLSEDDSPVFVPHPYDCNKYFVCAFDTAIEMSCPPNLQFDPNLNVCNYPDIVGCVNTPEPTTSTETITTPEIPETTANTTSSIIEENYDDEYFVLE